MRESHWRTRLERFASLGLRGNPFQVVPTSDVPQVYVPWATGDGPDATAIARAEDPVTQIAGPMGWGKSTLLAAVEEELREAGAVCVRKYLPPESSGRVDPPPAECRVLLIDEAQRLRRRSWRRLVGWTRTGPRRLVVTTHADLAPRTSLPVVTVRLPAVDAERLRAWFARRVEWAGGDPRRFVLPEAAAEWLIERCRRHVRLIEEALYEVFQTLGPAEVIELDTSRFEPLREWLDATVAETMRREERLHGRT